VVWRPNYVFVLWLVLAIAVVSAIARGFWLYRASLTWPTADGKITRLDVDRVRATDGGHYYRATFTYDFRDSGGNRVSGNWYKNFRTEANARDFAARELPIEKAVIVRFHPNNPSMNNLELDSWTYTDDRPLSLGV
jgi:hypothetical protein